MNENYGDGKKDYPGKLAESDVIEIAVRDPRKPVREISDGLWEVPVECLINIPVVFDFTAFRPPYWEDDDWWYYDMERNTVHVMIGEDIRSRFIELMKKQEEGQNLTRDERVSLTDCEVIINTIPREGAERALKKYTEYIYKAMQMKEAEVAYGVEEPKPKKKEYRTRKGAGSVDEIPAQVPAITNKSYQNAMTLNQNNKAYMQPLSSTDNLVYENGQLLFEGFPATAATLKRYFTSEGIENFDLPLLRVFYAIILNRFAKTWNEDKSIEDVVTLYYPNLARMLGKSPRINQENVNSCINSIMSFQTIMGIIDKGKKGTDILPVLVYMGNDVEKNTISFASPYMVRVIRDIYKASIRKSKTGLPMLKKNGEPQLLPSYSYMIKTSIAKEKNKKAVEIVFIIIVLIEQCGNNKPHIKASTIIERNQLLKESIQNSKTTSDRNKILKRAFSKAWEILPKQTNILEKYINIQLPKPTDTPTMSCLDMVFSFPHDGKKD